MIGVTPVAVALVLGVAFAVGVWLVASVVPRWGAPSLVRRIGPYVRDVAPFDSLIVAPPIGGTLVGVWDAARARLSHLLGGSELLVRRLRQAGWEIDASRFRGRQLAWGLVGLGTGALVAVALALVGRGSILTSLIGPLAAVAAVLLYDARLTHAARTRRRRVEDELPTVLEFLSLCLAAGEGLLDGLRRVSSIGTGELTGELKRAVVEVGTGSTLAEALLALARDLDVTPLSRSVDHLVAAIDRGAPLALVLQAQAVDAREDAKRTLIELAGRKEIFMLLPLVFLILPLSVLFAVFPGIFMLRLGLN